MKIGDQVKVKSNASGSDRKYSGRIGVVVQFDPSLPWFDPRALLAPEDFICVHFIPRNDKERRHGSPMSLLDERNLKPALTPQHRD